MSKIFNSNMKNWMIFIGSMIIVFLLGLLAASVIQRRTEAVFAYAPKPMDETESRNEIWGEVYPREYESWKKTADTSFLSKYNGSGSIDMLEVDPRLVILWAGYGFSKDYNQARGHAYAVDDIVKTLRTGAPKDEKDGPMPATCWTCKSSDVPKVMKEEGIAEFYTGKWARLGSEIKNSIGCLDCHDPKTMNLHISRPALSEAFARMGKDIKNSSQQEMRSLVCAQCHAEYYFRDDAAGAKYLVFPWDSGITVEAMEKYYDALDFSDWKHAVSRAPMLKAQHPGWEIFTLGIHAERGVSCADCHMPYMSEGAVKYTDHHIQSPLNNVSNSCQVCHREEAAELIKNVYDRQDKIIQNRNKLEELLVRAHIEAKTAWDKGATELQMKNVLQGIRKAQWRWDFAAAGHGASFHSPVEVLRIIATGITVIQDTRIEMARILAGLGYNKEIPYPDISTKAKAQEFIGLDIKKLNAEKQSFMETIVPQWLNEAAKREAQDN